MIDWTNIKKIDAHIHLMPSDVIEAAFIMPFNDPYLKKYHFKYWKKKYIMTHEIHLRHCKEIYKYFILHLLHSSKRKLKPKSVVYFLYRVA